MAISVRINICFRCELKRRRVITGSETWVFTRVKKQWARIGLSMMIFAVIVIALKRVSKSSIRNVDAFKRQIIDVAELSPTTQGKEDYLKLKEFESHNLNGTCDPAHSLVFLKTHKTGSTSLQTIIKQHLQRSKNKKRVVRFPHPFVGGYPGLFRKEFCYVGSHSRPYRDLTEEEKTKPPDSLIGHFRFQKDEIRSLLNPGAKYITIMRNPVRAFESSFHYFYKELPHQTISCRGEPYLQVLKELGMSYEQYLERVNKSVLDSAAWGFRSRNSQAFDLGLDPSNENREYILQKASDLDETFDLVVITEYFLESLVLLKDLLCVEWEDVIPSHENKGYYEPHIYNDRQKAIVDSLLRQDSVLYDYFNKSLWRKVDEYGRERMEKDLKILRTYGEAEEKRQVLAESIVSDTLNRRKRRNLPFNTTDRPGHLGTRENLLVERMYRKKGRNSVKIEHVRDLAQYMAVNGGWCPS